MARTYLKSGIGLVSSHGVVQLCAFARNLVIARLLSPADFGVTVLFTMTFSLLEMASNLGADKLLIQAEDGNEPRFQGCIHLIHACRGVWNAVCLLLLAGPISDLFNVPEARWAFRWLAFVPLMRGLTHHDPYRVQRDMRFRPIIIVDVTSSVLATLFAILFGLWLRDYSVMLWVLILQAFLCPLVSHLVAERPYRWAFDRRYARRLLSFGWPLLVNGLLLCVTNQGDRFVIGSAQRLFPGSSYDLTALGIYSVAFSLAAAPTWVIGGVGTSLFLPGLSHAQRSREEFERRYVAFARTVCVLAALSSIPVIVGGPWLVLFFYGPDYAVAGTFIGWLAATWALRIIRMAPTLAALAKGDTINALISNVVRSVAFVGVLLVIAFGQPLTWVAACGFFGEVLATVVSLTRLDSKHGVPTGLCLKPAVVAGIGMGIAALARVSGISDNGWIVALGTATALMVSVVLLMLLIFPEFRRDLRAVVSQSDSAPVA